MRRVIPLFIMIFMFIGIVRAEECELVSGSKNKIGSEVVCGSEHFYIIGSTKDEVKMMSKYNLYVGAIYDKINLDANTTYTQSECVGDSDDTCYNNYVYFFEGEQVSGYDEFISRIKQKYNLDIVQSIDSFVMYSGNNAYIKYDPIGRITINNKVYLKKSIKLYTYNKIEVDNEKYALQDESALGVTGEKGNANYPINATIKLFPSLNESIKYYSGNYDNFLEGYTNFEFIDGSSIISILADYYDNLDNMGYQVSNVDLINIKELVDLVKEISGKDLPLTEWYDASYANISSEKDEETIHELGDLKQYLSDDYKWLWNTSYWTKTFVGDIVDINDIHDNEETYFVSSSGDICYSWSGCGGIPRAGLRPVVTMSKNNMKVNYKFIEGMGQTFNLDRNSNMRFRINMEYEDFVNNGKIFIDDQEYDCNCYVLSKGSTIVTIKDSCSKKMSLGKHSIKATLNNGEYVAVTDFLISNDTPLISIIKQVIDNPNTTDKMAIFVFIAFTSLLIICAIVRKKMFSSRYESI